MPDQIDLSQMESVPIWHGPFLRLRRHWKYPSNAFWDAIWGQTLSEKHFSNALRGYVPSPYLDWLRKYLGDRGKLLEAGCGLGHLVLALRSHGYDCWGLDFAAKTLAFSKNRFPGIPFLAGDIRHLPIPDDFLDAYLSFGVIEHFPEGQDLMLAEAARVVRPGGLILLSVPALNAYRRLRIRLGTYAATSQLPFFEDCYCYEELKCLLNSAGFECLNHAYLDTVMTFIQESPLRPLYRYVEDTRRVRSLVNRFLATFLPRNCFGHMLIIVARRSPQSLKEIL